MHALMDVIIVRIGDPFVLVIAGILYVTDGYPDLISLVLEVVHLGIHLSDDGA